MEGKAVQLTLLAIVLSNGVVLAQDGSYGGGDFDPQNLGGVGGSGQSLQRFSDDQGQHVQGFSGGPGQQTGRQR